MNKQRILPIKILLLSVLLLLSLLLAISCGPTPPDNVCTAHTDSDGDEKCDVCGAAVPKPECTEHKDENTDGKCDTCGADVEIEAPECKHEDKDKNGKCDECNNVMDGAIALFKNGKTSFSFVLSSNATSSAVKAVDKLAKELSGFGIKMEKLEDLEKTATDYEILIGVPESRGEEYRFDEHTLGYDGFTVRLIGNKLLIAAGSAEALPTAIEYFRTEIIGLSDSTKKIRDTYLTSQNDYTYIKDDYRVTSVSVNGEEINGFVIGCDLSSTFTKKIGLAVQEKIYKNTGYWLDLVKIDEAGDKAFIIEKTEITGGDGLYVTVTDTVVKISCEYNAKLEEESLLFFDRYILAGKGEVNFTEQKHAYTKNVRDIYYKDFGAKGDGKTDDYEAIKAAHEYANKNGHIVYADRGAKYYIGKGHTVSAKIATDTYWGDAIFIVDDSEIKPFIEGDYGERVNPERQMWIFQIVSSKNSYSVLSQNLPQSLSKDVENIGFAPGQISIVRITNSNHKNYIRYGGNADDGASQTEVVLVDADGNILEGTKLMWDYETVTAMYVTPANDTPITVSGGEFHQTYNKAPSVYTSYTRGIQISRSNATLTDVKHKYFGDQEATHGAPMSGFTNVFSANNVTVQRIEYDEPKNFYTMGSGGIEVVMGSYEIGATYCTNITWQDCKQLDFWRDDDPTYAKSGGLMGTNHCKNMNFINMTVSSFDAHCGAQNVNIIGGHIEHINCIGAGEIYVEGTTIYTKYQKNAINLRSDYGSLWLGNATFKNVTLATADANYVALFSASWYNHDFGYRASMPTTVTVENMTVNSYTGLNEVRLAHGGATTSGKIWLEVFENGTKNLDPYMPTKNFIIKNNFNGIKFTVPQGFAEITEITEVWDE